MTGEEPPAPFADRVEAAEICDALWEGAYLFACFVQEGPMVGPVTRPVAPHEKAVSFAYYNTLGGPYAWRRRYSLLDDLNASLRSQVTECVIESDVHYGFTVRRILAKLHPDFFRQLVASGSYRLGEELSPYNERLNSVVRELCPEAEGHDRVSTVRHILYLEPREPLLPLDWAERGIDPVPLIERCRDYFSTVRYNEIPVILQDVILAPAMGYGNRGSSCVAVRLRPMEERWAGDMHIPIVPLHYLNHIALCEINKAIVHLLDQNDLSSDDYWSSFADWRTFENYEREFLQRRVQAEELIQRASESDDFQEENLDSQFIYKSDFHSFPGRLRVKNPHVWWEQKTVPDVARREHQESRRRLKKSLKKMRDRVRILEAFLRDAASADFSRTNLKLARSVQTLSWVVLVVSLLSLAVSIIPEERRNAWWAQLTTTEHQAGPPKR